MFYTAIRHLHTSAGHASGALLPNPARAALLAMPDQALEVARTVLLAGQRASLRYLRDMSLLHI